jgi:hypothetical protein
MDLNSWPVIVGGLVVGGLLLVLAVVAAVCLVTGVGPKARAKQENARARRQEASDEGDEVRAERRRSKAVREETARKGRAN